MNRLTRLLSAVRALIFRRRFERDMEREWAFHLDTRIDDLVAGGLSRTEAEQRARDEFGDTLRWKEQGREARGLRLIDELRQDTVYALRQMTRAPGFTFVAIVTLALGIGANTAIFSVVNAVLLRPLPYPDSDRLVRIVENVPATEATNIPQQRAVGVLGADLGTLRAQATTLSHIGVYAGATSLVTGRGEAVRLDMVRISPSLLAAVRAQPMLGRKFEPIEETPGNNSVVILSHATWQRLFGGSPDVIRQGLTIDSRIYTVIGVMPSEFQFPDAQTQLWIPYALTDVALRSRLPPLARLADGVSMQVAGAQVAAILPQLQTTAHPRGTEGQFALVGAQEQIVAPVKPALLVLIGAVGFVLLIACVNVASLLLARAAVREREMAVRLALGAGRGRLIRQLLTESLLLSAAAGIAGVTLARGGVAVLQTLGATLARRDMSVDVSIPRLDEIGLDWPVLVFTLAVSLLTGVLAGLTPALRHSRVRHAEALRQGTTSLESGFNLLRRHRAQGLLVIAEIAMATVLLVGGGLLAHSFSKLSNVDPGYDPRGVVTFNVFAPSFRSIVSANPPTDAERQRTASFAEELTARVQSIAGVRAVGFTEILPLVRFRVGVRLRKTPELPRQAPPPPAPGAQLPPESPDARVVSWNFMNAMGMRVIAGRGLTENDGRGQPQVMLINRTLARSGFLGENPIGARVYGVGKQPWEVVGIVDDVRQYGLDREPDPQIFMDIRQTPSGNANVYFAVRSDSEPAALIAAVRGIARQLEPQAIVDNVATMEQLVSNSVSRPRLYAALLGIFAFVAVTLATIGIYGVMAYAVSQRTREIGVRMALGAEPASVMRLVLGQSAVLIALGVVAGLAGAGATTRYLEGMLFGLTPLDAPTFTVVAGAFTLIAMLAAFIPARRATRIDPLVALRCE